MDCAFNVLLCFHNLFPNAYRIKRLRKYEDHNCSDMYHCNIVKN
jgi:hypothetical protein